MEGVMSHEGAAGETVYTFGAVQVRIEKEQSANAGGERADDGGGGSEDASPVFCKMCAELPGVPVLVAEDPASAAPACCERCAAKRGDDAIALQAGHVVPIICNYMRTTSSPIICNIFFTSPRLMFDSHPL